MPIERDQRNPAVGARASALGRRRSGRQRVSESRMHQVGTMLPWKADLARSIVPIRRRGRQDEAEHGRLARCRDDADSGQGARLLRAQRGRPNASGPGESGAKRGARRATATTVLGGGFSRGGWAAYDDSIGLHPRHRSLSGHDPSACRRRRTHASGRVRRRDEHAGSIEYAHQAGAQTRNRLRHTCAVQSQPQEVFRTASERRLSAIGKR